MARARAATPEELERLAPRLLAFFSKLSPLAPAEAEAIRASLSARWFDAGHLVRRAGAQSSDSYFVLDGCLRELRLVDDVEHTTGVFLEGEWVLSLAPTAASSLVCVEPSVLAVGNAARERALFEAHPRLETVARLTLQQVLAEAQERAAAFLVASPLERWRDLVLRRPDVIQRVPQYQLASYVGVTPESLSRIRRRLARKPPR